jgi:arginyl-tRNA synthetase
LRQEISDSFRNAVLEEASSRGATLGNDFGRDLLEVPKEESHGDFSSTLPLKLAKEFKDKPRFIAEKLLSRMVLPQGVTCSLAGPGFINFKIEPSFYVSRLADVLKRDKDWGRNSSGEGKLIQVEFGSANPTGPLSVGHGRQVVIGDAIASILGWNGFKVHREYYVNDAGNQIRNLALSVRARYEQLFGRDVKFPEEGYKGEYINELAARIKSEDGDKYLSAAGAHSPSEEEAVKALGLRSVEIVLEWNRSDVKALGVEYDTFYREHVLHEKGEVLSTLEELTKRGLVYEQEGAKWLKTTAFGDDKDRVLMKSDGSPTYALVDIAYHRTKYLRGYGHVIDIFGADHHSYLDRLKAAVKAMNGGRDMLEVIIHQFVTILKDGKPVRMSKRAGDFVTLRELVEDVGKDVARYFFLMRKLDSHLDFDLELAKKEGQDNPVYYLHYGHARGASIIRKAAEKGIDSDLDGIIADSSRLLASLTASEEGSLAKKILGFEDVVYEAGLRRAPHFLTHYAMELACEYHTYYEKYPVLDSENKELSRARLALIHALRITLRNLLYVLGLDAPERM